MFKIYVNIFCSKFLFDCFLAIDKKKYLTHSVRYRYTGEHCPPYNVMLNHYNLTFIWNTSICALYTAFI